MHKFSDVVTSRPGQRRNQRRGVLDGVRRQRFRLLPGHRLHRRQLHHRLDHVSCDGFHGQRDQQLVHQHGNRSPDLTAATCYGVILQVWKDGNTRQKIYVHLDGRNSNDSTVRGTPTFNSSNDGHRAAWTKGTSYDVQVRATQPRGNQRLVRLAATAITQDAPSNPSADGDVTRSIAENSAAGSNVGAAVTAVSTNTNSYTLHPRPERNGRRQVRDCQRHRADYREVGNQPGLRIANHLVQRQR